MEMDGDMKTDKTSLRRNSIMLLARSRLISRSSGAGENVAVSDTARSRIRIRKRNYVGPLQLVSYSVQMVGIRTGLPLPSGWEMVMQLLVYFLVEDYTNYWLHRWLHCKWGYDKIHSVHHEYAAPIGFAAPYAHWAEILILGIPTFFGPAMVPGHIITFWSWIILRQMEAIEMHSGYLLNECTVNAGIPWSPAKYIPFYGGAEYHNYHHYVGGQSQSNFSSVFTYCDYFYGTDKGYRYQKHYLEKLKEAGSSNIDGIDSKPD
ncbi:hypothetical protein C5167_005099 [Papaver somniferum]|uniref:Fatty acid hydroxylase domain-containing protein n=1 Tax=Papaver somniferum TaxID=3469 RepID=A0A4Y7JAF2_PAPSO|nr:hypothetical protein C5167_005099 [Papaver somniferum]